MGQADWTDVPDGLNTASLSRVVTNGLVGPNGGNGFVYACNSLDGTVSGVHARYVSLTNFAPTGSGPSVSDGGGSVRGCVQRVASPGNTGMSPFLFFALQGLSANDYGYLLGLSDNDPYQIVLAKAPLVSGLRTADANVTILRSSADQYNMGDGLWHHLRLDVIVQPNGDVKLVCFENDLSVYDLSGAPSWQQVGGMADFIDDPAAINSGSLPLWGGYAGLGFAVHNALNRRGAFDAIELYRQT